MNSGLQVYNEQNKLAQWAQTVAQCRDSGLSVRQWCQEHGVNVSSYYKWQRKVYAAAKAQQESRFVEVTPEQPVAVGGASVTIRISASAPAIRTVTATLSEQTGCACSNALQVICRSLHSR